MKRYGIIYKVTNIINEKCYIGQTTTNMKKRKLHHLHYVNNKKGNYFHNSIRKYGEKNFRWEEIDYAEYNQEELDYLEKYWIKFYNSNSSSNGYNLTEGGSGVGKLNPEIVKKRSENFKGYKHTEESKKKISKSRKGKPTFKGLKHSDNTKNKISMANTGNIHTEKAKEKIRQASLKRKHSDRTKVKISDALKGRKLSKNHIEKARKGRTKSLELEYIIECYFNKYSFIKITKKYNKKYNVNISVGPIRRVLKDLNLPMNKSDRDIFLNSFTLEDIYEKI